jgi:uncharacterized protein YaaN involved in tellurite resistance
MVDDPIVPALFPDEVAPGAPAPPDAAPLPPSGFIPSADDITRLGAGSREAYAAVTAKLLEGHRSTDLGDMGQKLNELITVAKGIDVSKGHKSLTERAMGFMRSEREQILARMQTVQGRLTVLKSQIEAMVGAEQSHVATLAELQKVNVQYHTDMRSAAGKAEDWLASVNAEIAKPVDESDAFSAPHRAALQQMAARLDRAINDFRNAMTLAKQEALTIQLESNNCQILLDEFERSKTIVLPALESIVAQQLIQLDQKHAAETDALMRATLDDALRTQARLTGDNSVELATLQQGSLISTATLLDCESILDAAAVKVREIEATGRQLRLTDAANRTQVEQRLLARFKS